MPGPVQDLGARCYSMPTCNGFLFQPQTRSAKASGWMKTGAIENNCTSVSPYLTTYALSVGRPVMPPDTGGTNVGAIVGGEWLVPQQSSMPARQSGQSPDKVT